MPEHTTKVDGKEYDCKVSEVFSGDDLIVFVDLGVERLWLNQRIRLHGVDTPPAIKAGPDTEGGRIRSLVRNMTRDRKARLTIVSRNANSWVAVLVVQGASGPVNINDFLISQGYKYQPKEPEKV